MVEIGQVFKNYKELCAFLGEKERTGKSKELQLSRWQRSFSFHKEGYKIVIDRVYKDYIEDTHGGNNQHVREFLPYVLFCLIRSEMCDTYVGNQKIIKSEMKLVNPELYDLYNLKTNTYSDLLPKHGVRNYGNFLVFTYNFEHLAMATMERCFGILERGGGIKWKPAQVFFFGDNSMSPVYVTGYEEILSQIEESVCNEMNPGQPTGRRFLHFIKRYKHLAEKFYQECSERLLMDEKISEPIRKKYKELYGKEPDPKDSVRYYRLYYIESIDRDILRKWKLDKPDSIQLKKALVNPVGPEMQTLKDKVYKDIFLRMNKKNKFEIPEKEFENLIFLFHQEKLTNKNYKAKEERIQDHGEDQNEFKLSDWV